jgi:hypothetical protein
MRVKRTLTVLVLAGALQGSVCAQTPSAARIDPVLVMFVKNALTAVNHANLTGNYSVLRDLGSEGFRQRHTAADLANVFANHRREHYDLSPILVHEPQFTQPPTEVQPGRLKLVGFFPTQPQAVHFAVVYLRTEKGWGIDEISVGMAPIKSLVQASAPAPSAPELQ